MPTTSEVNVYICIDSELGETEDTMGDDMVAAEQRAHGRRERLVGLFAC